jgi:Fanconi anemia group M protein
MKISGFKGRLYQERLFASAAQRNTLVVLPTGLGKTMIAMMLAVHRGKTLFLAPTKPLCVQHMKTFEKYVDGKLVVLTGEVPPDKRKNVDADVIFATPQTIENDLICKRIGFKDFKLVIFDEAHRAVGDYSYVWLAKQYNQLGKDPLILGLTASPGHTEEEIGTICTNLFIKQVESRVEKDVDVGPYVKEKSIKRVLIDLPDEFSEIKRNLERTLAMSLRTLKTMEVIESADMSKIRKGELLKLKSRLVSEIGAGPSVYQALSEVAVAIKVLHVLELLQTVGVRPLKTYFKKMGEQTRVKANKKLLSNPYFKKAMFLTMESEVDHPKYEELIELLTKKKKQAIVFTQYRDTCSEIVSRLKDSGFKATKFIGQAGKEGMSQKKQIETINDFKYGVYEVLVATSIAEEGLHIPEIDIAVFFEPVPSALRTIQRKGRVGRTKFGEVYVMITKGTIDESYFWVSFHKERKMKKMLDGLKQKKLDTFQ